MPEQPTPSEPFLRLCRDVLAPLVEADGGILYLVTVTADDVHLHLSGTCAGCPGSTFTRDRVLGPALVSVAPKAKLRLTTGVRIPDGALRIEPLAPKSEAKSEAKA
jgi:Fe-S cluster biogenesis protein NfuA